MTPIRVVVVEDMTVLREALVGLLALEADIKVVGEADRGDEVVALIDRVGADVVLLDVDLPGADGVTVARRLHAHRPDVRVLMLSALDRPGIVHDAMANHVHGFLPKGVSIDALLDAVRRVHNGEIVIPAQLLSTALNQGRSPLSRRESMVLGMVARGDSAKEVGRQLGLATGTVQNHMTHMLVKLKARNKVEAIRIATEHGWLTASD